VVLLNRGEIYPAFSLLANKHLRSICEPPGEAAAAVSYPSCSGVVAAPSTSPIYSGT